MPQRRSAPVRFRPITCSDALDGSNIPGAMLQLGNLVPDPAMAGSFVPRPAAFNIVDFAAAGFSSPGFISALLIVGNTAYGMISTSRNALRDEPFAINLLNGAALPVFGVAFANVPVSPPATGPWTPPIVAQVGSRVIVTHLGFPGGPTKFGWFDVSGFTETTAGNTHSSALIDGNPSIIGVQPGMTVAGTGIPAGATVLSTDEYVNDTTGTTDGTTAVITGVADTTGIAFGQIAAGLGIPIGATVVSVAGSNVTISVNTTSAATSPITFSGATITLSAAATASANGVSLTLAGGTAGAPLWGAGDTDRNPLPSVPVGVAQFNGRAYYALGTNGIVYSDAGFPTRVSNTVAVQALTTNDGLSVTAIAPLMLSTLLGGIVGSLVAFEGVAKIQQIAGDQSTGNLTMTALPVATGTASPLAIVPCELGTAFLSPEGMRIIQFSGQVSDPVGDAGSGVTNPFIYSLVPSRACGAANAHILRFTVQNGSPEIAIPPGTAPWQEWWFDIGRKCWSGPMTILPSLIQPWQGSSMQNTFVVAPQGRGAILWQSDPVPYPTSAFVENGEQLMWTYQPAPLPDNQQLAMNAIVDMTIAAAFAGSALAIANDIDGSPLDQAPCPAHLPGVLIWNQGNWNDGLWGPQVTKYQQWPVYWHVPLVCKQLDFSLIGASALGVRLSSLYLRYEITGYPLPVPRGLVA